ncbi:unnamed protein product [Caenorhabditis auriculariae]|uniref:arginine kinase n=1 Tax=Caenorhabditis auriculariae TaxID=2777116 RepID=A0A8S1H6Z8_9PELO|nr:unnamed protein product [Caenorhabditis auriculariae]
MASPLLRSQSSRIFAGLAAALGGGSALYVFSPQAHAKSEVDSATIKKIEEAYQKLNGPEGSKCKSLLKKHLTKDVVDQLKTKKTKLGATLYDCIRSGVYNLDAGVGVYAPDAESYRKFAPLFDKIIEDYHGFSSKQKQPPVDLGENKIKEFPPLDPKGKYIKSTRIRCGRSLQGYPFNPCLNQENYLEMEQKVKKAFNSFTDKELQGKYYPLDGMSKDTQKQLIADHFLFKEGDRHLQHANACNFWPKGRGIYHNNDKTFLIWVNEEDHMRIISMEEGSDVGKVLDRLVRGVKNIEKVVPFSRDERLGWLTFCPTNLGSTVRASVHIKLPKLAARKDFIDICEKLNLQVRGIHGEHSDAVGGVYDISNKARLGLSEYQAVKQMYDGVKKLIEMEEKEKMTLSDELEAVLSSFFEHVNEFAEEWTKCTIDCNFENFEAFLTDSESVFEEDQTIGLRKLHDLVTRINTSNQTIDLTEVFSKAEIHPIKFLLFLWYFLETFKKAESKPELGPLAASIYLEMCIMKGSKTVRFFQEAIYQKCLKICRGLSVVLRFGDVTKNKKGKPKSKSSKKAVALEENVDETVAVENSEDVEISSEDADNYLQTIFAALYQFISKGEFFLPEECLLSTMDIVEELARVDMKRGSTCSRVADLDHFERLSKWCERCSAIVHAVAERPFSSCLKIVYGRLIRPRIAMIPFPNEGDKSEKSTEKSHWADLAVSFVTGRAANKISVLEVTLIRKTLMQVFVQCPDRQDFRTNIAQNVAKILGSMSYAFQYDFVQLMNLFLNMKTSGIKQISIELSRLILDTIEFDSPDPGPLEIVQENDDDEVQDAPGEESEADQTDCEDRMDESRSDDEDRRVDKKKNTTKAKEKKKKSKKSPSSIVRKDAQQILFNILLMGVLDKNPTIRCRSVGHFARCIEDVSYCEDFVKHTNNLAQSLEDKFQRLNVEEGAEKTAVQEENDADVLFKKLDVLEKMNEGKPIYEKDFLFSIVQRLLTDSKPLVRKASCQVGKIYLSRCADRSKFSTIINLMEALCRDNTAAVRKHAAQTINELMTENKISFKDLMSEKWLNCLFPLLEDAESEVQAVTKELVLNVVVPLLEAPNDLTWELLKVIEGNRLFRQYFMTTLAEGARTKVITPAVAKTMENYLHDAQGSTCAWMVFSQLSIVFKTNVNMAIDAYYVMDNMEINKSEKYIINLIVSCLEQIGSDEKNKLLNSMKNQLLNLRIHQENVKEVYLCVAKLLDGVGEQATGADALKTFAKTTLDKCFDVLTTAWRLGLSKADWDRCQEEEETKLIRALQTVSEALQYSPSVLEQCDRFAKTLLFILQYRDEELCNSVSGLTTYAPNSPRNRFSQNPESQPFVESQPTMLEGLQGSHMKEVPFSVSVRAVCALVFCNMCIADERLLITIPRLVKQLQNNVSYQIRSNILVGLSDVIETYKLDRYSYALGACLNDPSVLIRRQAVGQITRLVGNQILRFQGEIMVRLMLAVLDENPDVREDAKISLSEVLKKQIKGLFKDRFVEYMIYFTQAKREKSDTGKELSERLEVNLEDGQPIPQAWRIALYKFMISSLDDRDRFDVKKSICLKVLNPIANGEYAYEDSCVQAILDDSLRIMACDDMRVRGEVGVGETDEAQMDDVPDAILGAAQSEIQKAYQRESLEVIVPSILNLREYLKEFHSPLLRTCLLAVRSICVEHKGDTDEILKDNKQLQAEMAFELKRIQERKEEAYKIIHAHWKKVVEYNKKQNIETPVEEAVDQVEMEEEPPVEQPESVLSSPATKTSKMPLSPKTVRKLRRSISALVAGNILGLKPLCLDDTQDEAEKTPRQSEKREQRENPADESQKMDSETPKTSFRRLSSRRCTSNPVNVSQKAPSAQSTPVVALAGSSEAAFAASDQNEAGPNADAGQENCDSAESVDGPRRSREGKPDGDESSPAWKKPRLDETRNVTVRRSARLSNCTNVTVNTSTREKNKTKSSTTKPNPMETTILDESLLPNGGRLCSTPLPEKNNLDLTFGDLDMSHIDSVPASSRRPSTRINRILHDIEE